MKENDTDQKFDIPITRSQNGIANGARVPMQYLCWWLGQNLQQDERPVVDMTGLTKNYDFTLTFLPQLPPNFNTENIPPEILNRPSLFEALQQQLGLKLDTAKGPGRVLRDRPCRTTRWKLAIHANTRTGLT